MGILNTNQRQYQYMDAGRAWDISMGTSEYEIYIGGGPLSPPLSKTTNILQFQNFTGLYMQDLWELWESQSLNNIGGGHIIHTPLHIRAYKQQ